MDGEFTYGSAKATIPVSYTDIARAAIAIVEAETAPQATEAPEQAKIH